MTVTKYSTERFQWSCHEVDSVVHLSFQGELDFQSVRVTLAALRESLSGRRRTVVLDMSELSLIDSAGLGMLIRAKRDVETFEGRLVVSRVSPAVKRVVDVTRLNEWFDPVDDAPPKPMPCPVCDSVISPRSHTCGRCGSAL